MSKWPKITLKSQWGRLHLVPPTQEDDADVAAFCSDPVVLKHIPFFPRTMTAEEWAVKREENSKNDNLWHFHIHLTPELVPNTKSRLVGRCGLIGIDLVDRHADAGILLPSNLHRTGIATEALFILLSHAFEHPDLKLHRVAFQTGAHNVPMRGWLEKFGLGVEYRLREAWADGEGGWIDVVGYRILENEWPDMKMRLERWLDARNTPKSDV